MTRAYYTLAIREEGRWAPQFGDYDKATVEQEAVDSYFEHRALDRRIVKSADDRASIDAAIARLNRQDPLLPFAVSAMLFPRKMERAR